MKNFQLFFQKELIIVGVGVPAARGARDYTREMTDSNFEFYQRDVIKGTLSLCNIEFYLRPVPVER